MQTRRRCRLAVGVIAFAALCSAAGADAVTTSYQSKADALCIAGLKRMKALRVPTSTKSFISYLQTEARLGDSLLDDMSALRPPKARKALVGAAIKAQRRFQNRVHLLIGQLKRSSQPKLTIQTAEPELTALARAARKAWRKAGLPRCAA